MSNERCRRSVPRSMKLPIAVLLAIGALNAQPTPSTVTPRPAEVVAQGEGVVSAKPDQVRIQIGVTTQAGTAQEAASQNAKQSQAVITELKQQLGASAEIQTSNYALHPTYRSQRDGSKPVIAGYQANNTVEVRLNDVAIAGKVIDAATKSGANEIQGVQFSIKDEQKLRMQALAKAATQARANVEALAGAVGLRVTRILRVQHGDPVHVMPMRAEMFKAADAMQTPIEPGDIQVRANVTLTAEVSP